MKRQRVSHILLIFALALLASPLFAATISGTVTRASDGAPLAGVPVNALRIGQPFGILVPTPTVTDVAGQYRFDTLQPGLYYVEADAAAGNYVRQLYPNGVCPPSRCDGAVADPGVTRLDLIAQADHTGIDLALSVGGAITGTIRRGDTTAAIPDATVTLLGLGWTATSNSNGAFAFTRAPAGDWWLRGDADGDLVATLHPDVACAFEGCSGDLAGVAAITLGSGMTLTARDVTMQVGARISGQLLPTTAAGGQQVTFRLLHQPGATTSQRVVDIAADGSYALDGLAAGDYRIAVHSSRFRGQVYPTIACTSFICSTELPSGTPVSTSLGQTTTGIDFMLTEAARIQGTLIDAATLAPISGVTVVAYRWETLPPFPPSPVIYASDISAADGSYLLEGIPALSVRISTQNSFGYFDERFPNERCGPSSCQNDAGAQWPLDWGDLLTADFDLDRGASVFGSAPFPGVGSPFTMTVEVYDLAGQRVLGMLVNPEGSWQFRSTGLAPGGYRLRAIATFLGGIFVGQVYGGQSCDGTNLCEIATGSVVQLGTGVPVEVNFTIPIPMFRDGFE